MSTCKGHKGAPCGRLSDRPDWMPHSIWERTIYGAFEALRHVASDIVEQALELLHRLVRRVRR